ncbi:glycosyltransferase [Rhizorhapis suberifaciens]|uniref:Glycosyltransferase involved in cell wall biosynthesis n=1 Tax=Rhizorhapis suberifaciens TaxID=13656 RepID=A0A840HSC2_9SPHN|nr:glycosyltransferase [Rhizorhapis suberifaciens]MBB4640611.1 glycosyltransferase involved in cell wall biosynthesis [Rhizorhapis suberifaciens]
MDRVAILLANYLVAKGVRAELWMARTDGSLASLIASDVVVRQIPTMPLSRGISMLAQLPALRSMLRQHRPDILYSAGNQSNLLAACAVLGTPTKAVGRISNPIVRPGSRGLLARLRHKRFQATAWLSRMTIVMGAADAELLAGACGALRKKITLLPRPTVTPLLRKTGEERPAGSTGPVRELLAVGRLVPQKDHRTMLSALAQLTGHVWRLRIVGQGPLLDELKQYCRALGIDQKVEFLGFVGDPNALAELYGSSELLLQSSRWEGLTATAIEALACGCGVVITDCTPNLREIIADAGHHPMVPVGDVTAFAAAIDSALSKPGHPARAREAVRSYDVDTALAEHHKMFASLVR